MPIRMSGWSASAETPHLILGSGKRPDIRAKIGDKEVLFDVRTNTATTAGYDFVARCAATAHPMASIFILSKARILPGAHSKECGKRRGDGHKRGSNNKQDGALTPTPTPTIHKKRRTALALVERALRACLNFSCVVVFVS